MASSSTVLFPSLSVIAGLPSPTSLQVAAAAYSVSNGTTLVMDGCSQPDKTKNCTAACQDLSQVFKTVGTFQNCLAFPTISHVLLTANPSDDYIRTAREYGISTTDTDTTSRNAMSQVKNCLVGYCNTTSTCHAFDSPNSFCYNLTASRTYPIVLSTEVPLANSSVYPYSATQYIDASTVARNLAYNLSLEPSYGTLGCISALCDSVKRAATVDMDIGGVGIYVSYFMQAGIVLLALLLFMFWDSGLYQLTFCLYVWSHGPQGAIKIAAKTHARYHEHKERVTEGLIEFLKARCFFMLAIQVAALAAKHGSFLGQSSLQQIHNNDAFIDVLAIGGFLPITFVLYALRTVGYRSIYMSILSFCTVLVSAGAVLTREKFPVPQFDGTSYSGCNGANPVALCLGTNTFAFDYDNYLFNRASYPGGAFFNFDYEQGSPDIGLSTVPLVYCLVVLTLLFFDLCCLQDRGPVRKVRDWILQEEWPPMRRPSWIDSLARGFSRLTPSSGLARLDEPILAYEKRLALTYLQERYKMQIAPHVKLTWHAGFGSSRKFGHRLAELFNLAIFTTFLYFMATYVRALTLFKNSNTTEGIPIDLAHWSFGQFVAVTAWLPALIQYAYLEINGMQGQRWHLPKGYKVVSIKPDDTPVELLPSTSASPQPAVVHRRSHAETSLMQEHDEDSTPILQRLNATSQRYHRLDSVPRRKPVQTSLMEE